MKKSKLIIIGTIGIAVIVFLWWYINGSLYKSKANVDKVNITYSTSSITAAKDGTFNLGVILNAESAKKISAVDLNFKYNSDNMDLIDYVSFQTIPENYFDEKVIEATSTADLAKNLRLVLVSKKQEASLSTSVTINLSFKAKNADGQTTIDFIPTLSTIVGTTVDYSYDLTVPTPVKVIIGDGGPTSAISPTSILIPTIIPATGNANLTFKVRFQGIISTPKVTFIPVKIIVKKQQTVVDQQSIGFRYDTTATDENKGVWIGSGAFNVPPGSGYSIFIKGPFHVQKKICDIAPVEALGAEGTYRCSNESLTVSENSSFDFSKITLLVGDLPQQDGVVNSYDTSLVRNNLGKTDSDSLIKTDINIDGRINTQDYSLIIYALSIRTDEE